MRTAHRCVFKARPVATFSFAFALWMLSSSSALAAHCIDDQPWEPVAVTLQLEPSRPSPALAYKTETIVLYVSPTELADELGGSQHRDDSSPLVRSLRELAVLPRDLTFDELVDRLTPPEPDHPVTTRSEQWREYRKAKRDLKARLGFGISGLLDRGRVAGTDPQSGVAVLHVQRTRAAECIAPVVYRTMDGRAFLELEPDLP